MRGLTIAVLAGGRSLRFRMDKLTYRRRGRSILERTLDALAPLKGRTFLFVSGTVTGERLARESSRAVELWPDPAFPVHPGPGVAVASALEAIPGEWLLVVPGDQPFLETAALRRWLDTARSLPAALTSLWEPGRLIQPAFQLHHLPDMRAVGRRLKGGPFPSLRMSSLLRACCQCALLDLRALTPRPDSFRSVNRPEDWRTPSRVPARRRPEPPHWIDPGCSSLFWAGLSHYRSGESPRAYQAFFREATRHADSGRWLLSLHALEDAHSLGLPSPQRSLGSPGRPDDGDLPKGLIHNN